MTPPLPDAETLYAGGYTLVRMRPRQLAGMVERHVRERLLGRLPVDLDARYERRVPADPAVTLDAVAENTATLRTALRPETRDRYRARADDAARGTPRFLGRSVDVLEDGRVQWHPDGAAQEPLLWSLKLWGFDPLEWLVTSDPPDAVPDRRATFDSWIDNWIDAVGIGGRRYLRREWTPWAVSLRIQRFCRYLAWRRPDSGLDALDRRLRRELYKNALFLRDNLERDVGGNHLVENGAALLVAGGCFVDGDHDWLETGVSILTEAADRQFLGDGCHFERSPMYHVLVLTRYLTACDLLERSGESVPAPVAETAAEATAFLRSIRPPDARIPLLNDAVYDVALPLVDCLRYADAVGIGRVGADGGGAATVAARAARPDESGYRWLRTDAGAMLVDGGPVGPPHLPAHAHSDTLAVLLWLDGHPVLTDTGTYAYDGGPRRQYARGVRGHNTVQVGGSEPIALGGKYLLGPRPTPTIRTVDGSVALVEGRYAARPFADPGYVHHRGVYAGDDWWLVVDSVAGEESPVVARYHLHPDVEPRGWGEGVHLAVDGDALQLTPLAGTVERTRSEYYPRFGEVVERPLVELHADGARSTRLAGLFGPDRPGAEPTLEVDTAGHAPRRLTIGDAVHRLPTAALLPTAAGWND
jgi:uncharacterized heparinase superfamily protein